MTAEELHKNLLAAGFTLRADGGTLHVSPASRVGQGLQRLIRKHKAELLFRVSLPEPPALTPEELADIEEAVSERAAILEYDGNEDRATAEAQAVSAMRVYRLLIAMGEGEEPKWVTMLAPGCDLAEAERTANLNFPSRVKAVIPNAATKPTAGPSGPRQAHQWGLAPTQVPPSSTTPQNVSETASRV